MSLSLISIMQSDAEFGRRISKKVEEIKHDKQNLSNLAQEYATEYHEEIRQGTEKRAKLLSEGASRGLSEAECLGQYGRFLPSKWTPLLNLLYFLLRESSDDPRYGQSRYEDRDKLDEKFGSLREEDIEKTILKKIPDISE